MTDHVVLHLSYTRTDTPVALPHTLSCDFYPKVAGTTSHITAIVS